jgi:tetratricopeptide (TPR) repeat protein
MKTAWNLVREGVLQFHRVTRDSHEQARKLFQTATKLDPVLPEAHIWLARVCGGMGLWGWSDRPEAVIQEGLTAAMTAIRLDEKNPYAHYGLAITSCAARRLDQAVQAAHHVNELSSSFALGHLVLGMAHLYAGRATEARNALQQGLRLNAYDPHNFVWFDLLALAHLFLGERDPALAAANKALEIRPDAQVTLEVAAICCAELGEIEKAARYYDLMRHATDLTSNILGPLRCIDPAWTNKLNALVRKASTRSPRGITTG